MLPTSPALVAVVDDDESVRKGLQRFLRAFGHSVETYSEVGEFQKSLKLRRPDCVLLDLLLPGKTGLDLLQQLAKDREALPTIVITGDHSPDLATKAMQSGARAVLWKPIDGSLLLEAIAAAISESHSG